MGSRPKMLNPALLTPAALQMLAATELMRKLGSRQDRVMCQVRFLVSTHSDGTDVDPWMDTND